MKVIEGELYHIYNRGNQKQQIFFDENNYWFFLDKVKQYLVPCTDILSWSLMPNHFHFLLYANEKSASLIYERQLPISNLSEAFRLIQSSYTKGINSRMGMSGNLFQQKFKSKVIASDRERNGCIVFNYIHGNAEKAGLVKNPIDWKFSSYKEYVFPDLPGICNKELAMKLLGLTLRDLPPGV